MARKQVNDLQDVQLSGAARQVNTFVQGPRAPRTNSALKLAETLSGLTKAIDNQIQVEHKLNIQQATENKLYGGTIFTSKVDEATAEYAAIKDRFSTTDQAAAWFVEKTTPAEGLEDPHTAAGFREAQEKALGKFRGSHENYLVGKRQAARTRDVLNDFFLTSKTEGSDEAFNRLGQIAKNYGMSKDQIDKIPLGAAKLLISNGRYDEAEAILTNKRNGAGSLTERADSVTEAETAAEAKSLLAKVQQGREDRVTAAAKDLRRQHELNALDQAKKENDFINTVLTDDTKSYDQKILEINKAELTGQVSDEFAVEYRRVLNSEKDIAADSDPAVISDIVQRVYDVNAVAESDPEKYLTGINNVNKELLSLQADGKISQNDFKKVQKQIRTLTSSKIADATQLLPRVYKSARENIEQQLPPEYQGQALRELYDQTESQRQRLEETDGGREELEKIYKQTSNKIIQDIQTKRRKNTEEAIDPNSLSADDVKFIEDNGLTEAEVTATAKNRKLTKRQVIEAIRSKVTPQ